MVNMAQKCCDWRQTFGEQSCVAIEQVTSEEPPVAEFVIALNQLNSVAFTETELIRATSMKVIYAVCERLRVIWAFLGRRGVDVRITTRVSPISGRGPSLGPLGGNATDMVDVGKLES